MLSRVNPTTFPLFALFVLDDVIILPKHKYENFKLPETRKPENKIFKAKYHKPPKKYGKFWCSYKPKI